MHGRGLDSISVISANASKFVAQHRLRRPDPGADWRVVPANDRARWVEIQVPADLLVLHSGSQQKSGGLERSRGDDDAARIHSDRVSSAGFLVHGNRFNTGNTTGIETQPLGAA